MYVEGLYPKYKSLPKITSFVVSLDMCMCARDMCVCVCVCIFVHMSAGTVELMWWSEDKLSPLFKTGSAVVHCNGVRLDGPIAVWILLNLPPISL